MSGARHSRSDSLPHIARRTAPIAEERDQEGIFGIAALN